MWQHPGTVLKRMNGRDRGALLPLEHRAAMSSVEPELSDAAFRSDWDSYSVPYY